MNDKLNDIVKYAFSNVPYYMNLGVSDQYLDDGFYILPIIQKTDILNHASDFHSTEYTRFPLSKEQKVCRTSGSTGKFLKVYWDEKGNLRSLIELWNLRRRYYNIYPKDKFCYFYTTLHMGNKILEDDETKISPDGRSIGFSKNNLCDERLIQIYNQIYDFDPIWIMMQPSFAMLFCKVARDHNLPKLKNLRYIELSGEMLFETVRATIRETFDCEIGNQYGCNEVNSVAYECPCGNLHLMTSSVFTEIIKNAEPVEPGQEGNICVTSYMNHAMPFIRYNTGDIGTLDLETKCECKNTSPILHLAKGRENDLVILKNGSFLPAYIFVRPIELINDKIGLVIKQFQIIQQSYDEFTIRMVLLKQYNSWREEIQRLFLEHLNQPQIADAKFNFDYRDSLWPELSKDKLAFFIKEKF